MLGRRSNVQHGSIANTPSAVAQTRVAAVVPDRRHRQHRRSMDASTAAAAAAQSRSSAARLLSFDPQPIAFEVRAPFLVIDGKDNSCDSSGGTGSSGSNAAAAAQAAAAASSAAAAAAVARTATLATQASLDRLAAFERQAAAWRGPASLAVYVPCPRGTRAAAAAEAFVERWALSRLRSARAAARGVGAVHIALLYARHYAREGAGALASAILDSSSNASSNGSNSISGSSSSSSGGNELEQTPEDHPTYDQLYPINALRNAALAQVQTPLVLQADADLTPSEGLAWGLAGVGCPQLAAAARRMLDPSAPPLFLALPVFEVADSTRAAENSSATDASSAAPPAAAGSEGASNSSSSGGAVRPRTAAQLLESRARPFHCGVFPQATPSIDLAAWWAAAPQAEAPPQRSDDGQGTNAAPPQSPPPLLEVQYGDFFEPSGVAATARLPRWDERFRGYGLNKAALGAALAAGGFELRAAGGTFLSTVAHARETTWRALPGTRTDTEQLERVGELYSRLKRDLKLE